MASWFRAQVRTHGLVPAALLASRVVLHRIPATLSNKLLPATRECPCCGWRGSRFIDYVETGYRLPDAACPRCDSHPRHRGFSYWLKNEFHLETKQGTALVFAPEPALAPLFESAAKLSVIKTDIGSARTVDVVSDVMQLPFATNSIDLIWCHHVLEQVEDDRQAMRELFRVFKSGGEMVISAGNSGQESTVEFGYSDKNLSGNRRLYGLDFPQRLIDAGFHVEPRSYNLNDDDRRRFGVKAETFYYCTKSA